MTSTFHLFAAKVRQRFEALSQHELFVVDLGDQDLFQIYLDAFPEGTNPIFRERTEHDCSTCKQFVRNLGRVVAIVDGKIETVWGINPAGIPNQYGAVAVEMDRIIGDMPIKTVFRTKEGKYGNPFNYDNETSQRWEHFCGQIASRHKCPDPDTKRSEIEAIAQVLRRGLEELTTDALDTVADLIDSNSLYRGEEHKGALTAFRKLHRDYPRDGSMRARNVYVWSRLDDRSARFRNTVIGTLVVDLSAGTDLEAAVRMFESKVAPENYKRPTALITPKMVDAALETLKELGLETAVERRFARLEDVSVNNVLFVDNSVQGQMRDGLRGALMQEAERSTTVEIKNAENISMDDFLTRVVPQATSISVLVENRHQGNFVSITAPVESGPGRLFKWNNDFAWSYDGEVADSIKQRVKAAGGKVDAKFRVSLAWSNFDDLDLHAVEPRGDHIYYGNRNSRTTNGRLDVDMNVSPTTRQPVENIYWNGNIPDGDYTFSVHQFTKREDKDVGFTLELEFDGVLHQFSYGRALPSCKTYESAIVVTVRGGRMVSFKANNGLTASSSSTEKWGVNTEQLVPVDTLMASPNHWDGQQAGNKHWFFILKGCRNPNAARGIYNEFLRADLDKHRKVFEVLGAKTKCPPADEQLSGVGFSSTRGDTVTVVVKGPKINRAFNIQF